MELNWPTLDIHGAQNLWDWAAEVVLLLPPPSLPLWQLLHRCTTEKHFFTVLSMHRPTKVPKEASRPGMGNATWNPRTMTTKGKPQDCHWLFQVMSRMWPVKWVTQRGKEQTPHYSRLWSEAGRKLRVERKKADLWQSIWVMVILLGCSPISFLAHLQLLHGQITGCCSRYCEMGLPGRPLSHVPAVLVNKEDCSDVYCRPSRSKWHRSCHVHFQLHYWEVAEGEGASFQGSFSRCQCRQHFLSCVASLFWAKGTNSLSFCKKDSILIFCTLFQQKLPLTKWFFSVNCPIGNATFAFSNPLIQMMVKVACWVFSLLCFVTLFNVFSNFVCLYEECNLNPTFPGRVAPGRNWAQQG